MPTRPVNDPATIEEVLSTKGKIAIVGLSPKPDRDSNQVARYLIDHGYDIVPVNPVVAEILGRKSYPSVAEIEGDVEIVDVFRRPDQVMPVVDDAIKKKAKYLWLQLGVVNDEAAQKATDAGMHVVMDLCIKQEHGKKN